MSSRAKILAILGCVVVGAVLAVVALLGGRQALKAGAPAEPLPAPRKALTQPAPTTSMPPRQEEAIPEVFEAREEDSWPAVKETPRGVARSAELKKASRPPTFPVAMGEQEKKSLEDRGILFNSDRSMRMLRRDPGVILLRNAIIDTRVIAEGGPGVDIPEEYRAPEDGEHFIVHFSSSVSGAQRAALADAGAVIEHYVPNRALAITAEGDAIEAIRSMPGVDHIESFHPYFKMSAEVQAYLLGTADEKTVDLVEAGKYQVLFFSGEEPDISLAELGAKVALQGKGSEDEYGNVECSPDLLKDIVLSSSVKWIEPWVQPQFLNDLARVVTRADAVRFAYPSYDGKGVVVCVNDSGVDFTHRGFARDPAFGPGNPGDPNSRIIHYEMAPNASLTDGVIGDDNGHGTHVSGSVLGNGAWSTNVFKMPGSGVAPYGTNQFAGVAPHAELVMFEGLTQFAGDVQYQDDANYITKTAYDEGARLMNNSWGAGIPDYHIMSRVWDGLVRDVDDATPGYQHLTVFFSAGNDGGGANDGTGGTAGTVGTPGNAKNVITVGAVEQYRLANNLPNATVETDSEWEVAGYSSRGPTPDGRVKPDIVAPGSYVVSAQSKDVNFDTIDFTELPGRDYRHANLDSGTNYAALSGTSMASPLATGAGALLFQHLTNALQHVPSPSIIKAAMVAGAVELSPWIYNFLDPVRTPVDEGWGMVDLYRSIEGSAAREVDEIVYFDEEDAIDGAGEIDIEIYTVDENNEGALKIVLAWSDYRGTPGTGKALVNDLDLVVKDPNGDYHLGNTMGKRGWGTSSFPFGTYVAGLGDGVNNVEVVIVGHTYAGDYEIQVRGWEVPQPSQPYSLVIVKGHSAIGGTPSGFDPDVAFHSDGSPVMVYSGLGGLFPNDMQIFVRRWFGSFGAAGEFGTWRQLKDKWHYHETGWIAKEAISASILDDSANDPAVAVNQSNDYVYVAWQQESWDPAYKDVIFFRYFDGNDWEELGASYRDWGLCDDNRDFDASAPVVGVAWDGHPVVAYHQNSAASSSDIYVKKWNGTDWLGLDGSVSGILPLPSSTLRMQLDMDMDFMGRPVLVWTDLGSITKVVQCYRWNGAAWVQVSSDLGTGPLPQTPKVDCDDSGGIFVTWANMLDTIAGEDSTTIRLAYSTGGGWTGLGGSDAYPGISGETNVAPFNPDVGVWGTNVFVAYQAGDDVGNYIFVKKWDGTQWMGVGDAGSEPGASKIGSRSTLKAMDVNMFGLPVFAMENNRSGAEEVIPFGLVGHTGPPRFMGLRSAVGTSSNSVILGWLPINDPGGAVLYHVYRTAGPGWSAADTNIPSPSSQEAIDGVFTNPPMAVVADLPGYVVTGLTADTVWYWGVRAENSAGFMESNDVIKLAGPFNLLGDADGDWLPTSEELRIGTDPVDRDSDDDGMWDGWEWYYSVWNDTNGTVTNTVAHTNALAMNPFDNGSDNVSTTNYMDGTPGQHPFADLDEDDMLNIEEFEFWLSNAGTGTWSSAKGANPTNWWLDPTHPDTDRDTMPDGWEYLNELNPGDASDRYGDLDGDALTNDDEYAWGTDPNHPDSDYDGVSDGQEVHVNGTFPGDPDTDSDGIDDNVEMLLNGDPLDQDSNNNDVDDNTEAQLGWTDLKHTNDLVHFILVEDCETGSFSNWLMSVDVGMWHRTLTEPSPQGTNRHSIPVAVEHEHTTNHALRFAGDVQDGTNMDATYDLQGEWVEGWLVSPPLNPNAAGLVNFYVSWMEYFETEPHWDICEVSASRDGGLNWDAIRSDASGLSHGWLYNVGDLNDFVLETNVVVRFRFKALNIINNAFRGWWLDDINIYGGARISGTVRDLNGTPIKGAKVLAIGRGGVTNIVYAHRYMYPGMIIADAVTDAAGDYAIQGLFSGQYYVKATAAGFQSEFWNGVLYTNADFYLAYGQEIFGGVPGIAEATNGLLGLTNLDAVAECNFELAPGGNPGRIGVLFTNRVSDVYLGQFQTNAMVWNGDTNNPAMVPYKTTNSLSGANDPDYEQAPMLPGLYDHAGQGDHMAWLQPGWPGSPTIPVALLPVRDGEITFVTLSSNQVTSFIDVRADVAGYSILLNGVDTGEMTDGGGEADTIEVLEGYHLVSLAPTGAVRRWIAPRLVAAPGTSRATVWFAESVTDGDPGTISVNAVDMQGRPLTNAAVFVDGFLVTSNDVGGGLPVTPLTLAEVQYGLHYITVLQDGYVTPATRALNAFTGQTTEVNFTVPEADIDYDHVGDALEMDGYTNIFAFSGSSDPDTDGVSSAVEYEQFLLHDVRMNIFSGDTDMDEISDGEELNYDGNTNTLGFSMLSSNAAFNDGAITVRFVGKFLEGESGLKLPGGIGPGGAFMSLEGDEVKGLSAAWLEGDFGAPWIRYDIPLIGESHEVIDASYLPGTEVFADTLPDRFDSDGDGMWDGFEHMFSEKTVGIPRTNRFTDAPPVIQFSDVGLRPLDAAETQSDPDYDGLINAKEFLGPNHLADTNDWTRPDDPDTDGDGMPDGWEWDFGLDARDADDAQEDPDNDTLVNVDEWLAGTDPQSPDTDTDLINDGQEVHVYGSDPTLMDTDLDGLIDGWEVISSTGDPLNPDGGFFPTWNGGDMDEDGFLDGPTDWDTDGDGMPDGFEVMDAFGVIRPEGLRLDPSNPNDAALDYDGDYLSNYEEWLIRDGKAGLSPNDFLPSLPVFGETGGVLVVEIESFPLDRFPGMDWVEETNYPGFTGDSYFTDLSLFDDEFPPYFYTFRPIYYFDITKAGSYTLELRHRHASADPDVQNMVWVRVDNADWRKTVSENSVLAWVFDTLQLDELDVPMANTYTFAAGRHFIEISEGLISNSLDRLHFYHSTVSAPDETVPESEIVDYVTFAHFVWDYPTEPFDSDSDDDGIPDGWEAWHGLHPRDPIPNPETVLGFLLRYQPLWLFYDLDNDGVHNRNEYDYRFVLDPNAESNALTGSLHPWFPDTDDDGLVDGDEIKSQRTNPLDQDTDGDRLADGQNVGGRWGEVETDVEDPTDFERALNDIWVYYNPIGNPIGAWYRISPDIDPPYTDVYLEENGYVAIEIEDCQFLNPLQMPRNRVIPENWTDNVHLDVTNLTYLSSAWSSPDPFDQLLFYRVRIQTPGIYTLTMHTHYEGPFIPIYTIPPFSFVYYVDASFWLKIDSGAWKKIATDDDGFRADTWNFFTKEVVNQTYERQEGLLVDAVFPLRDGLHTIVLSGRTWTQKFDRIILHLSDVDPTDLSLPISPVTGEVIPIMPPGRWGGAGAVQVYNISDPNQPGGDKAVYVGGLVFRDQIEEQALLRNNTFLLFGGRDGKVFFNEIWEFKDWATWDLQWEGVLGGGSIIEAAEGELVAATRAFVESGAGYNPNARGRPRPGGAPGYVYYDGDKDTEPYPIWGTNGVFNRAHTAFVTGWNADYDYFGGFAHDQVEDYTHTYEASYPAYYVTADDTSEFVHRWGCESDAFQTNRDGTVFAEVDNKVWMGAAGPSTGQVYYTGVNIGPVMNTWSDYVSIGGFGAFVAQIEFTSAIVVTNAFKVSVIGELYNDLDGISSEVPTPHATLTSPTDYFDDAPTERFITDPIDPEWTINTTSSVVTIPAVGINETVRINVTDQVREMFDATFGSTPPVPQWELGNRMGFIFTGLTNYPGLFKYWEENAVLRIQITEPPWRSPFSEIWIPMMPQVLPHERKSAGMAYDYANTVFTLFGGIDGNRVLDDTWVSAGGIAWSIVYPPHRPPARWGHGMIYAGGTIMVFGGFDRNNRPLNDLWVWNGADWAEVTTFGMEHPVTEETVFVNEKPPPRGAMVFGTYSGPPDSGIPVLFGGTDGKKYYNDTWVLQVGGTGVIGDTNEVPEIADVWRWIMLEPDGEMSEGPAPRAYAMHGDSYQWGPIHVMMMMGGRAGTLPTSVDTDRDWVEDGTEFDLGGPNAGRDPRMNALIEASGVLNTNAEETIPYAYKLLGGLIWTPFGSFRTGAVADFESCRYDEFLHAAGWLPAEGHATPPPTPAVLDGGFDALISQQIDLWWHRFAGTPPDDPRDEWELGTPHGGSAPNAVPPYTYSGRWCYGTDLDGNYEDNAAMDLYTPFFSLEVPASDSTSDIENTNDWYLVFHEWLDLYDENDFVRVVAVRPNRDPDGFIGADILTRVSGTEPPREPVLVLPDRNSAYNTTGEWRRVIVPITLKEPDLYFKFMLQSDGTGNAGGWYIDDVAILQGGKIAGTYVGGATIYLFGKDGTNSMMSTDAPGNTFSFDMLAAGEYRLVAGDGSVSLGTVAGGDGTWHLYIDNLQVNEIVLGITINSPVLIQWNAIASAWYEIQYTTPEDILSSDPWTSLGSIMATEETGTYIDWDSDDSPSRLYRVRFMGIQ